MRKKGSTWLRKPYSKKVAETVRKKQADDSSTKTRIDVAICELYRSRISVDIRRGLKSRALKGWAPFMPPLGYLNDPKTKTIIADPETWGRVRILLETAATKCISIPELAKFARCELALKCKNGKPFTSKALRRMIGNPFYAGYFWYDGEYCKGKHPTMITKEQFSRLLEILNDETGNTK